MDQLQQQIGLSGGNKGNSVKRRANIKTRHISGRPKSDVSSRSNSISVASHTNQTHPTLKSNHHNRSLSLTNSKLYQNLLQIKETQQNSRTAAIKQITWQVLNNPIKQNKLKLSKNLQLIHPFFYKINNKICEALTLLGKIKIYSPNTIDSYNKYNSSICHELSGRDDFIGFLLYGKIQLMNLKHFYSHIISVRNINSTVYEHNYIKQNVKERQKQIYDYDLRILEQSAVLWLSKSNLYLIRRECFLNMDLKYLYHEFQNHLKYTLIHKKAKLLSQ